MNNTKPTHYQRRLKPSTFREELVLSHSRKHIGAIGQPVLLRNHNPNYKSHNNKLQPKLKRNAKAIGKQPHSQSRKKLGDNELSR